MHVRRLDGKVLMVTGATRGIGLATAERLAEDGARVVLTARGEAAGREVEARLRGAGADVMFVPADMTEVAGPAAVVETAVAFALSCRHCWPRVGVRSSTTPRSPERPGSAV